MKILTKLMLASAVMVTSGFAGGVSEFQEGGTLEAGAKLEFESGGALTMNADKSLHVYGSVEGDGQINCQGTGQVIVYAGAYAEDSTNADAIKTATSSLATTVHTYDPNIGGHIDSTVAVDPSGALVYVGPNLCEYASALDTSNLVYVANSDGGAVKCTGGTETASEITCELANTDASIGNLMPASLVVENKVKFSGKNTGFASGTVIYGTLENLTETEITSQDAFFPVESVVERGSKLMLTAAAGTTISKNLTVNGCNKWRLNDAEDEVVDGGNIGVLNVAGPVVVTNGACLKIQGKTEEPICDYPNAYPLVKSWPEGSFSGDLNEVHKKFYTLDVEFSVDALGVTRETTLQISYNESTGKWNVESMGNMDAIEQTISVEYYPYTETVTFTCTDVSVSEDWDTLKITSAWNPDDPLAMDGKYGFAEHDKTALPTDAPDYSEAAYLSDGSFSLTYNTDNYVRSAPYMLVSPGYLDLGEFAQGLDSKLRLFNSPFTVIGLKYVELDGLKLVILTTGADGKLADSASCALELGLTGIEGTQTVGYFVPELTGNNYDALNAAITEIDSANRSNPNENQWLTLEEYNTKHGTNFSW